ncbi:hypothetical protein PPL_00945 [Heterostelium album PN500]|uniref:Transmembrane protein n=1 Tax=Heterostelium pallidum (strain ATCC 26659 / Pp 5 / PN500) TaxID=670386 RepID=D3AXN8_HETP5|nr:hypothetical protein PPL_00945 [Heterostelium album PN500]EFA85715.1 hypothetical protein PPL_00945 [Heterostelium album PN500]|eukprot:XP_020437821.1 hypothetical protein PPL_00945 [Heterostelium album PN500]
MSKPINKKVTSNNPAESGIARGYRMVIIGIPCLATSIGSLLAMLKMYFYPDLLRPTFLPTGTFAVLALIGLAAAAVVFFKTFRFNSQISKSGAISVLLLPVGLGYSLSTLIGANSLLYSGLFTGLTLFGAYSGFL